MKTIIKNFLFLAIFWIHLPVYAEGSSFLPPVFKAKFKQVYKSALTGKEKLTDGHIEYKYPGHLRFEIVGPNKSLFITNPEKTWYYNSPFIEGEAGEVTIKKTGKMVFSKFFDTLKEGLSSNKYYNVKKIGEDYHLSFSSKMFNQMGIKKSILRFKNSKLKPIFLNLHYIFLHYDNKKIVKMTFFNIEKAIKNNSKRFKFEIPKNTKVTYQ